MNEKQTLLETIADIVVACCNMETEDQPVTREKVLGTDKHENVAMTRTILANQIHLMGFTNSTIGLFLGRTPQAVGRMISHTHPAYFSTNPSYRVAAREASRKIDERFGGL